MTHERLAAIRKAEEEEACRILGIPAANIQWLGYDDGMLEYVDRRELTKQVSRRDPQARARRGVLGRPRRALRAVAQERPPHRRLHHRRRHARRRVAPLLPRARGGGPGAVGRAGGLPLLLGAAQLHRRHHRRSSTRRRAPPPRTRASSATWSTATTRTRADAQRAGLAEELKGRTPKENGRYVERFRRSEAY